MKTYHSDKLGKVTVPDAEAKHTPGPWRITENGKTVRPESNNENDICTLHPTGYVDGMISNGRLIAAAPELLEACQLALGAFENNNAIDWSVIEKAIAKATGGNHE